MQTKGKGHEVAFGHRTLYWKTTPVFSWFDLSFPSLHDGYGRGLVFSETIIYHAAAISCYKLDFGLILFNDRSFKG